MTDLADDVAAVLDDAGSTRPICSVSRWVATSRGLRAPLSPTDGSPGAGVDLCPDERSGAAVPRRRTGRLRTVWRCKADVPVDLPLVVLHQIPHRASQRRVPTCWWDAPDDQTLEAWRSLYLAQRAFDARADMARITAPTLVIGSAEDRLVAQAICD